jgi:chromosome segregation ATPase
MSLLYQHLQKQLDDANSELELLRGMDTAVPVLNKDASALEKEVADCKAIIRKYGTRLEQASGLIDQLERDLQTAGAERDAAKAELQEQAQGSEERRAMKRKVMELTSLLEAKNEMLRGAGGGGGTGAVDGVLARMSAELGDAKVELEEQAAQVARLQARLNSATSTGGPATQSSRGSDDEYKRRCGELEAKAAALQAELTQTRDILSAAKGDSDSEQVVQELILSKMTLAMTASELEVERRKVTEAKSKIQALAKRVQALEGALAEAQNRLNEPPKGMLAFLGGGGGRRDSGTDLSNHSRVSASAGAGAGGQSMARPGQGQGGGQGGAAGRNNTGGGRGAPMRR